MKRMFIRHIRHPMNGLTTVMKVYIHRSQKANVLLLYMLVCIQYLCNALVFRDVMFIGGATGFVSNALLIFKSGQQTGDYHNEMNFLNYSHWLQEQLIPNLPARSVVVMDNASYHNVLQTKHPISNSKKDVMLQWLNARGILYEQNATKAELYRKIKQYKPGFAEYSIDAMFAAHGHTVCRLPPYHPELNPIEKIWASVKQWIASNNVTFKLGDVEKLAREKFATIGAEEWAKVCGHVIKIEEGYIQKEHIMDEFCDEFIINVDDDSSNDEFDCLSDEDP